MARLKGNRNTLSKGPSKNHLLGEASPWSQKRWTGYLSSKWPDNLLVNDFLISGCLDYAAAARDLPVKSCWCIWAEIGGRSPACEQAKGKQGCKPVLPGQCLAASEQDNMSSVQKRSKGLEISKS